MMAFVPNLDTKILVEEIRKLDEGLMHDLKEIRRDVRRIIESLRDTQPRSETFDALTSVERILSNLQDKIIRKNADDLQSAILEQSIIGLKPFRMILSPLH